ncbi:hypothetical protein GBAR_LOCUS15488 [Geodia barretti]|uniref:Uncharacterized protein n=1 Tax=Geodia barretti TaxID=519541 RepID=A0AA35SDC3_GEOBA|nr:hypothetical protein GBAR_LOCUS15488 [Geodia barretti]
MRESMKRDWECLVSLCSCSRSRSFFLGFLWDTRKPALAKVHFQFETYY